MEQPWFGNQTATCRFEALNIQSKPQQCFETASQWKVPILFSVFILSGGEWTRSVKCCLNLNKTFGVWCPTHTPFPKFYNSDIWETNNLWATFTTEQQMVHSSGQKAADMIQLSHLKQKNFWFVWNLVLIQLQTSLKFLPRQQTSKSNDFTSLSNVMPHKSAIVLFQSSRIQQTEVSVLRKKVQHQDTGQQCVLVLRVVLVLRATARPDSGLCLPKLP